MKYPDGSDDDDDFGDNNGVGITDSIAKVRIFHFLVSKLGLS